MPCIIAISDGSSAYMNINSADMAGGSRQSSRKPCVFELSMSSGHSTIHIPHITGLLVLNMPKKVKKAQVFSLLREMSVALYVVA